MAKTTIPGEYIQDNSVGIDALNVTDGTNGQYLQTDGSGTLSFASATVSDISDLTATATELNYLDGVTGITLGTANELLVVGGDGSSIVSDSTLAVDTSNNRLGINQSSPEVTLHMTGEGAQTAQIRMEQYNDSADAPDIRTRRYRGTIASPSAISSGDYLFRSNHEYWNGSALITGGSFGFDNTNNANRTQFAVSVTTDGTSADINTASKTQLKIDGNDSGAITFNNAYKFPTSDGSANQVLTTDGSGTLSFADSAGGVDGIVSSADATAITIDSSENVGIGTTSPASYDNNAAGISSNLVVADSGHSGIIVISGTSSDAAISFGDGTGAAAYRGAVAYVNSQDTLYFKSAGSNRMVIDSSGNVGINETSPDFSGFGSSGGGLELDDVGSSFTAVRLSQGGTGDFYMAVNTGAAYLWGKANSPTVIGTNNTEAIRIDESQSIFINTTSGYGTPGYSNMWIQHSTGRQRGIAFKATSTSSTDTPCQFFNGGAGIAGQITYTYSATTYSTSSDYRLKENVVYDWDATTRLKQLKPCRFNWIADETNTAIDGFIAHEAAEVVPNSVVGEKDATKDAFLDDDGNEIAGSTIDAQTMDHAKLVPLLVKTIQELEARITTLENA
jgi:hypothetical protein